MILSMNIKVTIMDTIDIVIDLANDLKGLGVNRSASIVALKKKGYNQETIDEAIDTVFGAKVDRSKADWTSRVARLRELVAADKYTQAQMAEICVKEGLFGGMASAKQCMPYINMAIEWAEQEKNQ